MHWSNVFAARAAELGKARPELAAAVEPLLKAREAVERQIADLDRKVAVASPHFEILLQRRSCPITSLQSLTWNLRFQLNATPPDTVGPALVTR